MTDDSKLDLIPTLICTGGWYIRKAHAIHFQSRVCDLMPLDGPNSIPILPMHLCSITSALSLERAGLLHLLVACHRLQYHLEYKQAQLLHNNLFLLFF